MIFVYSKMRRSEHYWHRRAMFLLRVLREIERQDLAGKNAALRAENAKLLRLLESGDAKTS